MKTPRALVLPVFLLAPPLAGQNPPAVNYAENDKPPVHQSFTINSTVLSEERVINVYSPPAYASSPDSAFPVLYMLDGGMEEDFPHVANTIDSLIALGVIRPVLVVGVENTERRRDTTGPTTVADDSTIAPRVGGSANFRHFIKEEFIPEVRRRYRTTDESSIVGESLAGLFVVETFLLDPAMFQRYIALSPSLWWNGGALVKGARQRLSTVRGLARSLYLTSADETDIVRTTSAFAAILAKSAPGDLNWTYAPRPDLTHGTIFRALGPEVFAKLLR